MAVKAVACLNEVVNNEQTEGLFAMMMAVAIIGNGPYGEFGIGSFPFVYEADPEVPIATTKVLIADAIKEHMEQNLIEFGIGDIVLVI